MPELKGWEFFTVCLGNLGGLEDSALEVDQFIGRVIDVLKPIFCDGFLKFLAALFVEFDKFGVSEGEFLLGIEEFIFVPQKTCFMDVGTGVIDLSADDCAVVFTDEKEELINGTAPLHGGGGAYFSACGKEELVLFNAGFGILDQWKRLFAFKAIEDAGFSAKALGEYKYLRGAVWSLDGGLANLGKNEKANGAGNEDEQERDGGEFSGSPGIGGLIVFNGLAIGVCDRHDDQGLASLSF
jgi:hypothetical protein